MGLSCDAGLKHLWLKGNPVQPYETQVLNSSQPLNLPIGASRHYHAPIGGENNIPEGFRLVIWQTSIRMLMLCVLCVFLSLTLHIPIPKFHTRHNTLFSSSAVKPRRFQKEQHVKQLGKQDLDSFPFNLSMQEATEIEQ